jgi:hypothetical protein
VAQPFICFGLILPAGSSEFCMPNISADSKPLKDNYFHLSYIFHLVNKAYKIKTSDSSIVFLFLLTSRETPIVFFF